MQAVLKRSLQWHSYYKRHCVASVTKTFTLKGVQTRSISWTMDSLYAFKCKHFRNTLHTVTFGYHCKALFETSSICSMANLMATEWQSASQLGVCCVELTLIVTLLVCAAWSILRSCLLLTADRGWNFILLKLHSKCLFKMRLEKTEFWILSPL
jgi:hypothetical protein